MSISDRQDEPNAITLLAAQRQLYTDAKRLRRARMVGGLGLAIAGPIAALLWPESSAWIGAIAGGWLALARVVLRPAERSRTELAAAVQEEFDIAVLRVPRNPSRGPSPAGQAVARAARRHLKRNDGPRRRLLTAWYPDTGQVRAPYDALMCQRASLEWSADQHRGWLRFTAAASALWVVALVGLAVVEGYSLTTFLVSLLLPSIPALVDAADGWDAHRAHHTRQAAAEAAARTKWDEALLGVPLDPAVCRTLQDAIWDLRQELVHVPDWFYKMRRKGNEQDMAAAAAAQVAAAEAAGLT